MSADLEVSGARLPTAAELRTIQQQGLNRTIERARTFTSRRTIETYNLSSRQIAPYVRARKVGIRSGLQEGSVDLQIRAIPIEEFGPRVVTRVVTYTRNGRVIRQRLPTIELQRFRNGSPKLVGPAFPLRQRRSGRLRRGDKVRRRIGKDRDRLTRLRYYTFPKRFVREDLAPAVRAFAGPRLQIELDAAFRAYSVRTAQRVLRRNGP